MIKNLKSQLIHLISLAIAVSALLYSTWRTEQTELNTNIRTASFEVLRELSQLQLIIDFAYYDNNAIKGNPITGWGHIGLITDLSQIISTDVQKQSSTLKDNWSDHFQTINTSEESNKIITTSIKSTRQSVLVSLDHLN